MNTFKKEFLLLLRDPSGLLLLILMPAILLVIMTYVQDAPFKDFQDVHFDVLVYNKDNGKVSKQLIHTLDTSKSFNVFQTIDNQPVNEENFNDALQAGKYQVGIIFPKNTTAIMVKASNKMANAISSAMGVSSVLNNDAPIDTASIQIVFEPGVKPAMRTSLSNALRQYLSQTKFDILLERLNKSNNNAENNLVADKSIFDALGITETIQGENLKANPRLNSVQHNVPAWAIFGMFMIVVPIAGNLLKEKNDGSDLRVRLIPFAYKKVMIGKIQFYFTICILQFLIMLLIGLYLIPMLGLPKLYMGAQTYLLIPMISCIALTAVSYGIFIGSVFKTDNQAMPFGAISNVIFAALGGIWVPIEILPKTMQYVAQISPLYWSLEGVNNILIRDQNWTGILPSCSILLGISTILLLIAYRKRKVITTH